MIFNLIIEHLNQLFDDLEDSKEENWEQKQLGVQLSIETVERLKELDFE